MVYEYPLYLLGGYMLIDLPEGRTLLDPSRPFSSFSIDPKRPAMLTWLGEVHGVARGGFLPNALAWRVVKSSLFWNLIRKRKRSSSKKAAPRKQPAFKSLEVDAVLGMDLIYQTTLFFDIVNRRLIVGDDKPAGFAERRYESVKSTNVPVFPATLNRHEAWAVWDATAQFGFVANSKFVRGLKPQPGFQEFNPMFGNLEISQSFFMPFTLGGYDLIERVGKAPFINCGGVSPKAMGPFLKAIDVDVVLSNSWTPRVKIWLNPPEQTFAIAV